MQRVAQLEIFDRKSIKVLMNDSQKNINRKFENDF